jgi:hypothetical protein
MNTDIRMTPAGACLLVPLAFAGLVANAAAAPVDLSGIIGDRP